MDMDKLNKVGIIAKSTEQKSAHALKLGQQSHQQKCAQLDQLVLFRQEYEARLHTLSDQGIAARQLQDYRVFLGKLNRAIDQQHRDIQVSEESLALAREQWRLESRRKLALDQLLKQQHKEQLHMTEKAEQKIADEDALVRRTISSKP